MFLNGREPYLHFPKLKAKAAETKHLIPALATVWLQFMDNDSEAPLNQNPLYPNSSLIHAGAPAGASCATDQRDHG